MNRMKVDPPADIPALHTTIENAREHVGRKPRRLILGRKVYEELLAEVAPYLLFKTNKSGSWFNGMQIEVNEANPDDATLVFGDWPGVAGTGDAQ